MRNASLSVLALLAILLGMPAGRALADGPKTFEEAKTLAAQEHKPILVDFYAVWCGPCKRFAKAVEEDADIQNAVNEFVLFKTDAEKEGLDLANTFGVKVYPTFVVADEQGVTLDRWAGYEKEHFLTRSDRALADPTSMDTKAARYEKTPNAKDANTLAEYHDSLGEYPEAVRLYRYAARLDPSTDHRMDILTAVYYGVRKDKFQLADLTAAADEVLASKQAEEADLCFTAGFVTEVAQQKENPEAAVPYLKAVMERTEASSDEMVQDLRRDLLPDYALIVLKDQDKAIAYKKASMPEGWMEKPSQLNSYAWWCFENKLSLPEAYDLAKKGVDLSEPGPDRAMILDTLAEICNAMDDCRQALEIMQQAAADNPNNKHYQKQLKRFEDLVAQKDGK